MKSHTMMLPPSLMAAVDEWRRSQADLPSKAEAFRRLVQIGLKADGETDG